MKQENRALASISALTADPDEQTTLRRLLDCAGRARERQIPVYSAFLTPGEQVLARQLPLGEGFHLYGGIAGAERQIAAFLPDWMPAESLDDPDTQSDDSFPLRAVRITRRDKAVAGRPELTHRDYLGSLLGLGIRRDTLGDLCVGENGCDLLCLTPMAAYIADNLRTVGRVSVDVEGICIAQVTVPEKKVRIIRDTVASLRLDSVAASGFSLGRGKAADCISAGRAELNARLCDKPDRLVSEGDLISIRGLGRIRLAQVGGESRKGRIIITVERYL